MSCVAIFTCPLAAGRQSCSRGAAGHCSSVSHRRSLRHPTEGSADVQPQLGVRGRRHSSCARRRRSSKPGLCPHRTQALPCGKQKARSDGAKGRVWVAAQRPSQTAGGEQLLLLVLQTLCLDVRMNQQLLQVRLSFLH